MNKRTVWTGIALLLIGVAYLYVYGSRRLPPIIVDPQQISGSAVIFSFNDDVLLEEVKVVRPAVEPKAGEAYVSSDPEIMWHLIPRTPVEGEENPPQQVETHALRYGSGVRGLRRAPDIPRRGKPLEPGATYRFTATLVTGQVIEAEFIAK